MHFPDEGVLVATDLVRGGKAIGLPDYRDSNVNSLIDVLWHVWDHLYRYREPSQGVPEYQNAYPIGFPIGDQ